MTTITQVAQAMQTVLTEVADEVARRTGFVRRRSKLTGAKFCQTLVWGWLANPQASLEELAQTAALVGAPISPQAIDQRFSPTAAACLKQVLDETVKQVITATPAQLAILQRFNGVYLQDSSTVVLPDALSQVWLGCGGRAAMSTAALKLQVRIDMAGGRLSGPYLQAGRAHDRTADIQTAPLPSGALRLADLGYWSLAVLQAMDAAGVFWLSRLHLQTAVFDAAGQPLNLVTWLQAQTGSRIEVKVHLGVAHHLPARLLAVRLPQEMADLRRMRLKDEARRRGHMVSPARLKLADWNLFVTNVPVELLTLDEAVVVIRMRWQVELIFKLWKSHGHLDDWRSQKPWRILCEVYAKLIAVVLQHWVFLVGCWQYPNRSLFKAAQTVQKYAWHLAASLGYPAQLQQALAVIERCLAAGCRINKRKKAPHTYQRLLALTDGGLG